MLLRAVVVGARAIIEAMKNVYDAGPLAEKILKR